MTKHFLLICLFVFILYASDSLLRIDKKYFISPVEYTGSVVVRSDSGGNGIFGSPRNGRRVHRGVDLLADVGTPVVAARSGRVIKATSNPGMGLFVIIEHPQNMVTVYGHLSSIETKTGAYVRQGEMIGRVGRTGNAASSRIQAHLHFEVHQNDAPVDPLKFL